MKNNTFASHLMSRLFGWQAKADAEPAAHSTPSSANTPAAGQARSQIAYDSGLVGKLKADHAELFRLFGELQAAADRDSYTFVPEILKSFRLTLQTHLMIENIKFYAYLRQTMAERSDSDNFVTEVKNEMDGIARAVVRFTNYYESGITSSDKAAAFKMELRGIGSVLTKRVELEETRLYTLYTPNS